MVSLPRPLRLMFTYAYRGGWEWKEAAAQECWVFGLAAAPLLKPSPWILALQDQPPPGNDTVRMRL